MHVFLLRKLWYGLLVMGGVILVVFFLFNILPGDPARMMLGQRADKSSVEAINRELGLDKPVYIQFISYLNDLSPVSVYTLNDKSSSFFREPGRIPFSMKILSLANFWLCLKAPYLRTSYQSGRDVSEILSEGFRNTFILAVVAMFFALVTGIGVGMICALYKNSWIDRVSLVLSVLGMSLPSFFAAILTGWLFAFVLVNFTGLNLSGSLLAVDDLGRGTFLELKNLILPAFTLGIRPLAVIAELTRNSLLEVLGQDYIRTAKAKGLSTRSILFHHALKNALNPVLTAASGWFASLLSGAVFVEFVFDWKGIGLVIVNALDKYDFPVIMGAVLFISVILVIINITVDFLYGWLDPRVRTSS
jgi:peptide/nickel transport system permease protein